MISLRLPDLPPAVLAWLPPDCELQRPSQGATSDVILAVGKGQTVVIKRCVDPPYNTWLEHEYDALVALASTDLPIPRALGFHRTGKHSEDAAWLVMTCLPGVPLWGIIEETDDDAREAWFRRLGRLLARIHSTPVPASLRVPSEQPWLDPTLRRAASFVRRHAVDDHPELLERLGQALQRHELEVLVHGDFTLDNVLAEGDRLTGVIDWGGAASGDPAWDVTLALTTEPELRLSPRIVTAFFEGYRSAPLGDALRSYIDELYPRGCRDTAPR